MSPARCRPTLITSPDRVLATTSTHQTSASTHRSVQTVAMAHSTPVGVGNVLGGGTLVHTEPSNHHWRSSLHAGTQREPDHHQALSAECRPGVGDAMIAVSLTQ